MNSLVIDHEVVKYQLINYLCTVCRWPAIVPAAVKLVSEVGRMKFVRDKLGRTLSSFFNMSMHLLSILCFCQSIIHTGLPMSTYHYPCLSDSMLLHCTIVRTLYTAQHMPICNCIVLLSVFLSVNRSFFGLS